MSSPALSFHFVCSLAPTLFSLLKAPTGLSNPLKNVLPLLLISLQRLDELKYWYSLRIHYPSLLLSPPRIFSHHVHLFNPRNDLQLSKWILGFSIWGKTVAIICHAPVRTAPQYETESPARSRHLSLLQFLLLCQRSLSYSPPLSCHSLLLSP